MTRVGEVPNSEKIRPWMEGTIVARFRAGVRIYDLGYCLSRCGHDKPAKCPKSDACSRFQVYAYRFNQDGSGDWRQALCSGTREQAFKLAAERAESEERFTVDDKKLLGYIEQANKDGRI